MQLTEKQRAAVFSAGQDVLVSAAAGSGKTTVLSQRVVAQIEAGADVRRMLICTFTNAAAAEMRARISRALAERAAQTGDARLHAQAEFAQAADVCTIHKFAIRVVRENFLQLGLPHRLRVADEDEAGALAAQAMEEVFEALYDADDAQFLHLRDKFAQRTDDRLAETALELYQLAQSLPEGLGWLLRAQAGEPLRALYAAHVRSLLAGLERAASHCAALSKKYPALVAQHANDLEDLAVCQGLLAAWDAQGGFDERLAHAKFKARVRKLAGEGVEAHKAAKEVLRKKLAAVREFYAPDWREQLDREAPYMQAQAQAFHRLLVLFDEAYVARKRERGVMDYDEWIRHAYAALQNDAAAESYRARYDYVYIDEYQDTNAIQDALLMRVAPPGGLFMVGDVKQSIYRFRLADPLIFLKKAGRFESDGERLVVQMNENFRSAPGVLHAVNHMMRRLMSPALGELDYTDDQALIAGVQKPGGAELLLTHVDSDVDATAAEQEAHTIARRIESLFATGVSAGDICILLRSAATAGPVFARVLTAHGIPCVLPRAAMGDLPEVELFLCLLRLVDGDTSDVALLAALRSHVGGLTEADFAAIRAVCPDAPFRAAFAAYAAQNNALAEKCRAFSARIDRLRLCALAMPLPDLLRQICNECDYLAHLLVQPGGQQRARNFERFFAALQDSATRQESLFALLAHLEDVKRRKGTYFELPAAQDDENCVRIMTIHTSKGLEFPVVFLARTDAPFNLRDLSKPLLFHPAYGLACKVTDEQARTELPTLTYALLRMVLDTEQKSEELRVLYVAMTRARDQLLLSGCTRDPDALFERAALPPDAQTLLAHRCFLDWLLAAVFDLPCFADWSGRTLPPNADAPEIAHALEGATTAPEAPAKQTGFDLAACLRAAAQEPAPGFLHYPCTYTPVKAGVSSLLSAYVEIERSTRLPGTSGRFSATELGTLAHLFLQHASFDAWAGVQAQLHDMLQRQLLTPAESDALQPFAPHFERLMTGALAGRIRASGRVYRELPFSMAATARELGLNESDERVVVQGIVDLAFEEDGALVLVDYKSNMADESTLQSLAGHYSLQLTLYARALALATGLPVRERLLYFLCADRAVDLSP